MHTHTCSLLAREEHTQIKKKRDCAKTVIDWKVKNIDEKKKQIFSHPETCVYTYKNIDSHQ